VRTLLDRISDRYEAVLFDVGNTLVKQVMTGEPVPSSPELMPGVKEVMSALGSVRLGAVSNTTSMSTAELSGHLEAVGLSSGFEFVLATADIGRHKPDPFPLELAADKMGIDPSAILYVGDNESDKFAAEAAGMDFCYSGPDLLLALERFSAEPMDPWRRAVRGVRTPDVSFAEQLRTHLDGLVKPPGSLGRLEDAICRLAAIQRTLSPTVDPAGGAVFCADHGVAEDDHVSPWPQSISATMAGLIAAGSAASSLFARTADVYLEVIDVGLAQGPTGTGCRTESVKAGTANIRHEPALTADDVRAALSVGASTAERLTAGGSQLLCVGEVGIGNTTASAILISHFCGLEPRSATGRGSGIDDATLLRKQELVARIVEELRGERDPIAVAARVGGLEIIAIAGLIVSAAAIGVPVVLDGVTTQAAALLARALVPESVHSCIAGHRSSEPASRHALEHLALEPVIDLDMRLGEGTGALLAVPILRAACRASAEMAKLSDII
jgi:nicotinate-nucleotide--dimethylbenzimidazole phosphoribosyltransferase